MPRFSLRSFIDIYDKDILDRVTEELDAGKLWPEPLIQFNPAYKTGDSIKDLVAEGVLHSELAKVFSGFQLYWHQEQALRLGTAKTSFVVTSGTGSGKSLTYIGTALNHLLSVGAGAGVKALIVYPMNALINSQMSHHPGGWGGKDWNDLQDPEMPHSWNRRLLPAGDWQHPRGWMHGLAHGEIRKNAKDMDVFQALEGPDTIYPDGPNTDEALRQLTQLARDPDGNPFFLAFGILRPHLPFGAPAKYLEPYRNAKLPPIPHPAKPTGKTTWHGSGEFMKYNRWKRNPNTDADFALEVRRHYAACVTYADAQVGRMLDRLDELDLRDETIVVLWGDHGWHLGEHSIWGKHALFEESLRSPLIISYPGIPNPGRQTMSLVETLDIFPTLTDLAGLTRPQGAHGVSLRPILESPEAPGHPAFGYFRNGQTIRTRTHRLIVHKDGHLELYDHRQPDAETRNLAESQPDLARKLAQQIKARLK